MKDKKVKPMSFEEALEKLEATVQALESGNLSLEQSLKLFEEGIQLTRHCTGLLNEAEKKVDLLLATGDGEKVLRRADFLEAQGNG